MKVIILTGASGIGKTHMFNYAKEHFLGVDCLESADWFKARLALAMTGQLSAPHQINIGKDAFEYFVKTDLEHGLEVYEKLKADGTITGYDIIQYIEAERWLISDLPSVVIGKYLDFNYKNADVFITAAINDEELYYLHQKTWVRGVDTYVVDLQCVNPVMRTAGDNRTPCSAGELAKYKTITKEYELEQSENVIREVVKEARCGKI
jgi:hypothetical protein